MMVPGLSSLRRGSVVFVHDVIMAAASFILSLYLRFGDDLLARTSGWLLEATLLFSAVCGVVFWSMRLYRGVWRYASLDDLTAVTRSATLAILVFLGLMFVWTRLADIPRSLPLVNWFVLMVLLGGPRFLYRLLKDRRFDLDRKSSDHLRVPVLLAGSGDGAELFLRAVSGGRDANYRVVGILSETPGRVGRHIRGVSIMGTLDDIVAVTERLRKDGHPPQRLILTEDSFAGARVRRLLDTADSLGMTLSRLPKLTDFRAGPVDRVEIKPVDVADLLGRPQAALDRDAMRALVGGRRVLITGAGGSIGSELVRQVSDFDPSVLVLVESSEFNLYTIDMELARRHSALARRAVIADVRDRARIERLFAAERPELVFHAAALKHVPLVEMNIPEGVLTNAVGTANVAEACVASGVAVMVQISTDKAVNPSSVMGATKRIGERYCQALDLARGAAEGTRFVTVRFGNVLGSTGSVVPLFERQLAAGGPLTVTHRDMKRYFMTVREAVELVLQASAFGIRSHDQDGKIFVLDMGEPVRIMDLARQMIRLAGLRPDVDVKIDIIGTRPGEKLFEEIFHGGEPLVPTAWPGILLAAPRTADLATLRTAVTELAAATAGCDLELTMEILHRLVPEYQNRIDETTAI